MSTFFCLIKGFLEDQEGFIFIYIELVKWTVQILLLTRSGQTTHKPLTK